MFLLPSKIEDVRKNTFDFFQFFPGREKISSAIVPFNDAHFFFRALSCFPFFEGKQFVLERANFLHSREVLKKKYIVNSSTKWQLGNLVFFTPSELQFNIFLKTNYDNFLRKLLTLQGNYFYYFLWAPNYVPPMEFNKIFGYMENAW